MAGTPLSSVLIILQLIKSYQNECAEGRLTEVTQAILALTFSIFRLLDFATLTFFSILKSVSVCR